MAPFAHSLLVSPLVHYHVETWHLDHLERKQCPTHFWALWLSLFLRRKRNINLWDHQFRLVLCGSQAPSWWDSLLLQRPLRSLTSHYSFQDPVITGRWLLWTTESKARCFAKYVIYYNSTEINSYYHSPLLIKSKQGSLKLSHLSEVTNSTKELWLEFSSAWCQRLSPQTPCQHFPNVTCTHVNWASC